MADNKSFFDKIADFIGGKLDPEERQAFEQAMANDAQLAQEVQIEYKVKAAIDMMAKEEAFKKYKKWRDEMSGEEEDGRPIHAPFPGWARILLVLALLGLAAAVIFNLL